MERDKEILRDFFVYDKNKPQICAELDLTPEHFDRVLFRARNRLKQLIQHKLGNQDGKDISLLTVVILTGLFVYSSEDSHYFEIDVRDLYISQHLSFEALKTSGLTIPDLETLDRALTSYSRYV